MQDRGALHRFSNAIWQGAHSFGLSELWHGFQYTPRLYSYSMASCGSVMPHALKVMPYTPSAPSNAPRSCSTSDASACTSSAPHAASSFASGCVLRRDGQIAV